MIRSRLVLVLALGLSFALVACNDGGTDYTPCSLDTDCATGEACVAGECHAAPSCTADDDCDSGRVCLSGYCKTAECNLDADCVADKVCEEHRCVDGPDCDCATDADCAPADYCKDGCTCTVREVTTCATDAECDAGQLCLSQECQLPPSCTDDGECPADTVCDDGRCARPCLVDEDCDSQVFVCQAGHCLQQCLSDSNCQGGLICEGNVCVDPECVSDADCTGEMIRCHGGRCETYIACVDDTDCEPSFECLESICEERPQCAIDQDCIDQGLTDHACEENHCLPVPSCVVEADCDADRDCIGGRCLPHICRGPDDCGGNQLCVAGACQDPDPGNTVYRIIILNPGGPIHQGQHLQLTAIALTQAGNELPGVAFDWSSSADTSVSVDAGGLISGEATAGDAEIVASATAAGVDSDPVVFTNVINVQADSLRVTVMGSVDRSPIQGATVLVTFGGNSETAITDADGVAELTDPAQVADVHVFSDTHDYISIIGTTSTDILVPLPERSDLSQVGGYTGQMTYEGIGALSMGLAGVSLAGNLVDLDFSRLVGQVFNVAVPGVGNIPLPAQMVAELSIMGQDFALKDTYYVAGQNGLRSAWCMGGRLDQSVLMNLVGGGGTDIEEVLVGLLPYFSLLSHGVQPVVDVFPYPLVVDANDIDNDTDLNEMRPDWEAMLDMDLAPTTPQNLAVQITTPALPSHAGQPMRTAIYVPGALTPLGFTPLGMSAEQDDNGQIPPLLMKMAPVYGGLQVGGYAVLVLGFPQTAQGEMATDLTAVLQVADTLPTDVSFDTGFLAFPEDAAWDGPSRTMVATGIDGASLYRSTFRTASGGWQVFVAHAGTVTFSLPAPPAGMDDLAASATMTLDPVALLAGTLFEDLVTFNGDDLDGINRLAVAFARFQLQ